MSETTKPAGRQEMNDEDIFALTASYALGPGIQVDGVVEYDDYEAGGSEQGRDSDYTGISFGLGTLISF